MEQEPKVYTAYHFYLSLLLEYLLKDYGYEVEPLVRVGTLPLEVDIIIIKRQTKKKKKEFAQLDFLFRLLTDYNLIEFKGPTDTLAWQDYAHLLAMTELYRIKIEHPAIDNVRLFTIASTIPKDYLKFLTKNRLKLNQEMKGLFSIAGATSYGHYIVELNELPPDQKNELILFFSSKYHNRMGSIIGSQENAITLFLIQELFQKERRKMKFKIKDEDLVTRDLKDAIRRLPLEMRMAAFTPEEMLEVLKPEDRLKGLKPEDRLKGLKPEDRLKGLKTEELKRMKELLDKLNLN